MEHDGAQPRGHLDGPQQRGGTARRTLTGFRVGTGKSCGAACGARRHALDGGNSCAKANRGDQPGSADAGRQSGAVSFAIPWPARRLSDSVVSRTTGKAGYAPACSNKWEPGLCALRTGDKAATARTRPSSRSVIGSLPTTRRAGTSSVRNRCSRTRPAGCSPSTSTRVRVGTTWQRSPRLVTPPAFRSQSSARVPATAHTRGFFFSGPVVARKGARRGPFARPSSESSLRLARCAASSA